MFHNGDTIFISDDRLSTANAPDQPSSTRAKLAAVGHGLKRFVADLFRDDRYELEQIARDPRMLDDIGLTRADIESVLHRRPVLPERYPGWF